MRYIVPSCGTALALPRPPRFAFGPTRIEGVPAMTQGKPGGLARLHPQQLRAVTEAAQQLHRGAREQYLKLILGALDGMPEVGDGTVYNAIRLAMAALHDDRNVRL